MYLDRSNRQRSLAPFRIRRFIHSWLTNDVAHAVKRIKDNKPAEVTLHVRDAAESSVKVELGQKITW